MFLPVKPLQNAPTNSFDSYKDNEPMKQYRTIYTFFIILLCLLSKPFGLAYQAVQQFEKCFAQMCIPVVALRRPGYFFAV